MKKFSGLFILTGLMFSAGLFAAEASSSDAESSSSSASSSGGPGVSDGSVTLVANGTQIKLSREQLDLLDSRIIEIALTPFAESIEGELTQFDESKKREIKLSEEFDVATVQTLADILGEIAKTGSFEAAISEVIIKGETVDLVTAFAVMKLLDYLQASKLEDAMMQFAARYAPEYCLSQMARTYEQACLAAEKYTTAIDALFTPRVVMPNLRMEKTLTGHTYSVRSVAWSLDGKSLASASDDHTVRVWNVATGESSVLTGHTYHVLAVSWSPDGKSLASASWDHTVRVWNIANGENRMLTGQTGWVQSVCWSSDGKSLEGASDDGIVRVWNVATGESRKLTGHTSYVYSDSWSPDGESSASAGDDHTVRVWNMANWNIRTLTGHTGSVFAIAWSPDGKTLASASDDHTVRVWGNSELDACSPLQKLFILINLPKKPKMFERVGLLFAKLLERIGLRTGDDASDDAPITQWFGVYQSLPDQAKKILDKDVCAKYDALPCPIADFLEPYTHVEGW